MLSRTPIVIHVNAHILMVLIELINSVLLLSMKRKCFKKKWLYVTNLLLSLIWEGNSKTPVPGAHLKNEHHRAHNTAHYAAHFCYPTSLSLCTILQLAQLYWLCTKSNSYHDGHMTIDVTRQGYFPDCSSLAHVFYHVFTFAYVLLYWIIPRGIIIF